MRGRYRDDSLESVKRNQTALGLPLLIVSYQELYGWSMDGVPFVSIWPAGPHCTPHRPSHRAADRHAQQLHVLRRVSSTGAGPRRSAHAGARAAASMPLARHARRPTRS